MDLNKPPAATPSTRRPITPLAVVLAVVFVAFCGILIFVFVATKRANPVMLDQQGRPISQSSESGGGGNR